MSIWSEAPRIQAPPQDPAQLLAYVKDLANTTAKMAKDLEFILNGNIAFDNIRAGSIETDNLKAGAVTAEKITVNELSAISADLGKITAGEVYGTYIASREAEFPRAELKSSGDVFAAFYDANNYIAVESDYVGVPSLNFIQGGAIKGRLDTLSAIMELVGVGGLIVSATTGNLELAAGTHVTIQSWDKFYNEVTERTLQQDLNGMNADIVGLQAAVADLNSRVSALENP